MPRKIKAAFQAAFPHTIPVMAGMIFAGIAYGILMDSHGFGLPWILLTSLVVFAGALQFAGISLLSAAYNPLYAFLLALMINARHLFYGISMLEKYRSSGPWQPYLIYSLCDETFSILCSTEAPPQIDKTFFMIAVSALHQGYWLAGNILGALIGPMLSFNTRGLDFVMTAFFVVIFVNQWRATTKHRPALTGLGASGCCLLLFGPDHFIIPSMVLILALLSLPARHKKGVS